MERFQLDIRMPHSASFQQQLALQNMNDFPENYHSVFFSVKINNSVVLRWHLYLELSKNLKFWERERKKLEMLPPNHLFWQRNRSWWNWAGLVKVLKNTNFVQPIVVEKIFHMAWLNVNKSRWNFIIVDRAIFKLSWHFLEVHSNTHTLCRKLYF